MDTFQLIFWVLFINFSRTTSATSCTDLDILKIQRCYNDKIFTKLNIPRDPETFVSLISKNLLTHDVQICEATESLNSCLGDSIIQNCFNVDDFKNVPFARDSEGARKYILGYNHVNFFCSTKGTLPECSVPEALMGCFKENPIDCKGIAENVKCIEEVYTKLCGAKWGCTEEKFLTYDMCYSCSEDNICKSPTAANDSIDKMCTSDATSSFNNQLMAALAILIPLFSIV